MAPSIAPAFASLNSKTSLMCRTIVRQTDSITVPHTLGPAHRQAPCRPSFPQPPPLLHCRKALQKRDPVSHRRKRARLPPSTRMRSSRICTREASSKCARCASHSSASPTRKHAIRFARNAPNRMTNLHNFGGRKCSDELGSSSRIPVGSGDETCGKSLEMRMIRRCGHTVTVEQSQHCFFDVSIRRSIARLRRDAE